MEEIEYKTYNKIQMLKIIRKEGFLFVETNLGDNYIIRLKDLTDFIILEAQRTGHQAEMSFYMPGVDEPVITTFGWFLNKANPLLREEIIKRLVTLQTTDKKPKTIKIFDIDIFNELSPQEIGIENHQVKNFSKFYSKYVRAQNTYNIKMEVSK